MSAITVLRQILMKEAVKKSAGSSGIMTINKGIAADVEKLVQKYVNDALAQGVDLETLSPEQLKMIVQINKPKTPQIISANSPEGQDMTKKLMSFLDRQSGDNIVDLAGKKIDTSQGIMGGKSVKELMESGQVQKGTDGLKISEKITDRDMFKNSNLNKTDSVTDTITYIKTLEPIKAMKEANSIIGRKGKYKNLTPEESKKILQDTEDHVFQRDPDNLYDYDPEDMAKGGRAGFYTGGITDVEPSLDDIGHGADALNARTRLLSPGSQATTSTGLNYLLADDNDNMRIPFSAGGGGRRAFLKMLGLTGAGIAGVKSGIIGLGQGGAKKAVSETVKQAAGSGGQVPPYFLNLVKKIKTMGDDVTETAATADRQSVKQYKDYTLTEDTSTGNIDIIKKGILDEPDTPEVFMSLKVDEVPLKGKKGSTKVKEYEEFTGKRDYDGDLDVEPGVPDEVVQEGTIFEDTLSEFGKADGGRIGYGIGGLSKLGINSTSRRFLEKIFGKKGFETMIENDPRMHKGMLEVVEMFRNRDKEGLKMYLQKFMPDMGDAEIEKFIIGDSGTEGISGQLIRLGSGREYKNLINMGKEADNVRKLDTLDVTEEMIRKPNAKGGLQTMLGE